MNVGQRSSTSLSLALLNLLQESGHVTVLSDEVQVSAVLLLLLRVSTDKVLALAAVLLQLASAQHDA